MTWNFCAGVSQEFCVRHWEKRKESFGEETWGNGGWTEGESWNVKSNSENSSWSIGPLLIGQFRLGWIWTVEMRAFIPVTKSIIFAINSARKELNDRNNSISCSNCKNWNPKMRNWNLRTAHSRVSCQSWRARPARQFQPHLARSTENSPRWCVCVSLMSLWTQVLFVMFTLGWIFEPLALSDFVPYNLLKGPSPCVCFVPL